MTRYCFSKFAVNKMVIFTEYQYSEPKLIDNSDIKQLLITLKTKKKKNPPKYKT